MNGIGIAGERARDKPSLLKKFGSDLINLYSLTIYHFARKFEAFIRTKTVCKVKQHNLHTT